MKAKLEQAIANYPLYLVSIIK